VGLCHDCWSPLVNRNSPTFLPDARKQSSIACRVCSVNSNLTGRSAAAMKDGLSREAAEAKAEMSGLGEAATAAQAQEKAKVAVVDIKFNRNTALLSQEDVQIATQLKGLYPDVATALPGMQHALRPAARSRICDRKPAEGSRRRAGSAASKESRLT
jgi:hypothetical protein